MSLIRARYRAVNTIMNLPIPRGGYTPSAEVAAYLAKLTTEGFALPSVANQQLLDTFVSALKSAGVYSKLDLFNIWAQDSGSANAGRVNLVNPTGTMATIYNAIAFTDKVGISGDGVSAYVDTNFNIADDGVNYTQNNASFGGFVTDEGTSDYMFGLTGSQVVRYRPRTKTAQRINTNANITFATTQGQGFSGMQRVSSSVVNNLLTSGVIDANVSSTSTALNSANGTFCYLLSQTNYSNGGLGIGFLGASFTSGEWLALRNAVINYTTAVAAL